MKPPPILLAKLAFSAFLSYFLKFAIAFTTRPKPPSNRGSYDGLARNNVAKQIFSLKAVVQFLIAVVFLVVVGIEIFQHLNRVLGKRGIDVVEIENV